MALRIQAVTDRKVINNIALRAYKVGDSNVVGGNPLPVYKVQDSDLVENGGNFKVSGNAPHQFLVYEVENETPLGGSAIPMYIVNDTPPVPPPSLDPEYLAVEAFYSQVPSTTWRNAASQFFIDVRDALGLATLGDGFDFMYLLAHENAGDALINIVNPGTYDATNVNAMAFEASRGYTGNGSSSYLNSNYNPATQGVNYLQNSASFGVYIRSDLDNSNYADGGAVGGPNRDTRLNARFSNFVVGNININPNVLFGTNTSSLSLHVINRSGSNQSNIYKAGVSIVSETNTSVGVPNNNFFLGAFNNSGVAAFFSARQYAFAFAGGSMNTTQQVGFFMAVETFMDAIGAGVTAAPIEEPSVIFEPLTEVNELGDVLLAQQGINPTSNFGAYAG